MLWRDNIYTVHERADAKEPSDRIVLVREGFSLWAFVFTLLWLLANRLWLASALYAVLLVLIVKAVPVLHMSPVVAGALQFGLQLWLGFTAHDLQCDALARRGYVTRDVVCAESELLGARRYYDRLGRA